MSIACGAQLQDSKGDPVVPRGPVDTPPIAPGDEYIKDEHGHLTVHVEQVHILQPSDSYSQTIADPLRIYRPLPAGAYNIVAIASLRLYTPDAVVTRQDMAHKTWAAPKSARSQLRLDQLVPVEIR